MNEPLTGTLSIHPAEGNGIIVELRDHASRSVFLRVELTTSWLIAAMSGKPQTVLFETSHLERIGWQMQTKVHHVSRPKLKRGSHTISKAQWEHAMREFETDGWKGSLADCENPQRAVFDDAQAVTFTRYVNPEAREQWQKA